MEEQKREDALAFLKKHSLGSISSAGEDIRPHSAFVYYWADDDFSIYFFTKKNSRKYTAFLKNPEAAFAMAGTDAPHTIQMEGKISIVPREEQIMKVISALTKIVTSSETFFAPLFKAPPGETVLMRLEPRWIRWADFSFGVPGDEIFYEIEK